MQIPQRIRRDERRPENHAGADAGVEHPIRKYRYDARLDLDMDDTAAGALLRCTALELVGDRTDASGSELQLPARHGQNDCVMAVAKTGCSPDPCVPVGVLPPSWASSSPRKLADTIPYLYAIR